MVFVFSILAEIETTEYSFLKKLYKELSTTMTAWSIPSRNIELSFPIGIR